MKKSTKMHWYIYNNTVYLLNIAKIQIFYPVYNFRKFLNLTLFRLPAYLPHVRPGSTGAMAPDFSHKKGNHV